MGLESYSNVSNNKDKERLKRISAMIIPFGTTHKGKRLDEVPAKYLIWLANVKKPKGFTFRSVQKWVREYLKYPEIKARIDAELEEERGTS